MRRRRPGVTFFWRRAPVAACSPMEGDGSVPPDANIRGALHPGARGASSSAESGAKGAAALVANGPRLLLVDGLVVELQDLLQRQGVEQRAAAAIVPESPSCALLVLATGAARQGLVAARRRSPGVSHSFLPGTGREGGGKACSRLLVWLAFFVRLTSAAAAPPPGAPASPSSPANPSGT